MTFSEIKKDPLSASKHNLVNYQNTYKHFNWQQAQQRIAGNKEGLNIADEALDSHVKEGFGEQIAIRWLSKQGLIRDISFAQLMEQTSRFTNILHNFGVQPNDTVFGLCSRVPQLYIALLGTLRFGAVFSPLFSAFRPEPVRSRMEISQARVLITSAALYLKKVQP
ncbi:MAG: acetyl-CoA synthetase [Psychromonas sp.]|jgi:acetyl-CoA synthetase